MRSALVQSDVPTGITAQNSSRSFGDEILRQEVRLTLYTLLAISWGAGCRVGELTSSRATPAPDERWDVCGWMDANVQRQLDEVGAADWHEKTKHGEKP